MAQLISDSIWDKYKNIIRDAHDTFNQDTFTWVRFNKSIPRFFEDGLDLVQNPVIVNCLVAYNYFRSWPITKNEEAGELDNQNMVFYLNRTYLEENGWTTANGYFDIDAATDLFIHRGIVYKCEGDQFASQAFDIPLHILLILKRQPTDTGTDRLVRSVSNLITTKPPEVFPKDILVITANQSVING